MGKRQGKVFGASGDDGGADRRLPRRHLQCWYTDLDSHAASDSIYKRFFSSLPKELTACQFVDLTAFYSIPSEATPDVIAQQAHKVFQSSESFGKVKTGFSREQLDRFAADPSSAPLSRAETEEWARKELAAMVEGLAEEHGWAPMGMKESVEAFKEQKGGEEGQAVSHDAQGMVLGGGGGRKY